MQGRDVAFHVDEQAIMVKDTKSPGTGWILRRLPAAYARANTCHELTRLEGLDDVVVGAE